jgi:hypothetical protein
MFSERRETRDERRESNPKAVDAAGAAPDTHAPVSQSGLLPENLVTLYHELCPSMPRVTWIAGTRIDRLADRLREHPEPEWWRTVFRAVESTPWLRGFDQRGARAWPGATLDWLIEDDVHAVAVAEGKYSGADRDVRGSAKAPQTRTGALEKLRAAEAEVQSERRRGGEVRLLSDVLGNLQRAPVRAAGGTA